MTNNQQHAINILDMFEDVLDKHHIYIPDDDRTGDECEACIFGTTYGNLEDEITYYLDTALKPLPKTEEQKMLIDLINTYIDTTIGMEGDFTEITEDIIAATAMSKEYFLAIKDQLDYVAVAPQYKAVDIVWRTNYANTTPPEEIDIPFGLSDEEISEYINDFADAEYKQFTLQEIDYDAMIDCIFDEV